ncbi:MAG: hypothetical protein LWW76_02630 [Burkholderiales bacterium]|nr:hypothetical protein [Burkholderiales bacterium]
MDTACRDLWGIFHWSRAEVHALTLAELAIEHSLALEFHNTINAAPETEE